MPQGGVGRVLIYKTYKDPRTYMMHGDDIVWVRSLSGYRLGVLLPKGFAFISSNVAAQLTTSAGGQLRLAFANPSGQSNPVTIHARKTTATFPPRADTDMFFDDVKTLYDLEAPEGGRVKVEQSYSDYRKGARAQLDTLGTAAAAGAQGDRSRYRQAVLDREGRRRHVRQARPADRRRQAERAHQDHRSVPGSRLQDAGRRAGLRPRRCTACATP